MKLRFHGTTVNKLKYNFHCSRTPLIRKTRSPVISTLISSVFTLHAIISLHAQIFISSLLSSLLSPNSITPLTHLHYCSDPSKFHLSPHGSGAFTPNIASSTRQTPNFRRNPYFAKDALLLRTLCCYGKGNSHSLKGSVR